MRERRYAEGKETCRGYFKADYVWLAAQVLFFSRYFIFYSTHVKSTSVPPHTHTHPRSSAEEFDITLIINHALPHAAQLAHESS